jgi:hypothetical protein
MIYFQKAEPKVFYPPEKYSRGIFAGLDLLHARKPEGFVDEFFNYEKLSDIWDEGLFSSECKNRVISCLGLKQYRIVDGKYSVSGNHGTVPRYHYCHTISPTVHPRIRNVLQIPFC